MCGCCVLFGHVCITVCIVNIQHAAQSWYPECADQHICRLICEMLAAFMWRWAILLTWAHELPPARLCAVSGTAYWGLCAFCDCTYAK